VNVAGTVPLATKVAFALTNSLASNCAPGNSSAKIQKKEVSGPAVAIVVNPIECALEVNKTCCVPQPVLPDLDICEGDVVRMVLEYTGDDCSASNNEQGKHFHCYGRRKVGKSVDVTVVEDAGLVSATPSTGIQIGDRVEFTSSSGTLSHHTKFKTSGSWGARQHMEMDTSCERALACGDKFGGFKLVGLESTLGGFVDCNAPPPDPVCALPGDPVGTPCDAKLVDMVLEYKGRTCQNPLGNTQNGEATCSGDATGGANVGIIYAGKFGYKQQVSPSSGINDGDRIRVTSTAQGGLFPNQKYLITDDSGVLQEVDFHVSCSQPLALGDEFGSFKLVEFTTKNGTQVALGDGSDGTAEACQIPLAPPKPHCTSDLQSVTLAYIGDYLGAGCTVSNDQSGYASCAGVANPGDPVSVVAGPGLDADPTSLIEFGDLVTLKTTGGGELPSISSLDVTGAGGSQSIAFKTSCHKPLSLGDRFGSFVVFGMDRQDDGAIALGGTVQYQYKVTNPNSSQVDNVTIDDSELDVIASGLSIPAGESVTFTRMATLFGTTTNVVNVNGDVSGDFCDPGIDQVTVDVVVPPEGSFSCSCRQSLSDVTLIWNGAQTVDVKAWDGAPGTSTLLAALDDVAPSDEVTVGGFTSEASTWEIFDSTGVTKLGESIFNLSCRDKEMNGIEDCGKNVGNGKYDDVTKINDWLVEGMVDDDETMTCSPTFVPPPPACGFGPELLLLLPGLMWMHRRRI
jgi:hypothetical protein